MNHEPRCWREKVENKCKSWTGGELPYRLRFLRWKCHLLCCNWGGLLVGADQRGLLWNWIYWSLCVRFCCWISQRSIKTWVWRGSTHQIHVSSQRCSILHLPQRNSDSSTKYQKYKQWVRNTREYWRFLLIWVSRVCVIEETKTDILPPKLLSAQSATSEKKANVQGRASRNLLHAKQLSLRS